MSSLNRRIDELYNAFHQQLQQNYTSKDELKNLQDQMVSKDELDIALLQKANKQSVANALQRKANRDELKQMMTFIDSFQAVKEDHELLKKDVRDVLVQPSADRIVECLEPLANEIKNIQMCLSTNKLSFKDEMEELEKKLSLRINNELAYSDESISRLRKEHETLEITQKTNEL